MEMDLKASPATFSQLLGLPRPRLGRTGFNDGLFFPPTESPSASHALKSLMSMKIDKGTPSPVARAPKMGATGVRNVLVLLVDFPDKRGTQSRDHFKQLLFGPGTPSAPSLRSYYQEASHGAIDIQGSVFGWFTLPEKLSFYTDGESATGDNYPHNGPGLADAALALAVASGLDFKQFDQNGDGHLDGLIIVHAGSGAETEPNHTLRRELIWSHKWTLPQARTLDGVTVWSYTLQPEDGRIGVFCHEFGHFLGLPDLYDTSGRSSGVGAWCLMGAGSWGGDGHCPSNLSAWARIQLGWVSPTLLSGSTRKVTLKPPCEKDYQVIKLAMDGCPATEYFLLESRQLSGLDRSLPGEGLLIWHIDDARASNDHPPTYWVGVEQADGRNSLEYGLDQGEAGDPFPGSCQVVQFNDGDPPSARSHLGRPSKVAINEIAFDSTTGLATATVTCP
jgi:immune inhibitor A